MRFLSKFLRLLLKVTKITTGHQKFTKIGQNSIISFYFPKGRSPPQELEVGPRRGPYLLVFYIIEGKYCPAITIPATATATAVSRSEYLPWILKQGGLESSGRITSPNIEKLREYPLFFLENIFFFSKILFFCFKGIF